MPDRTSPVIVASPHHRRITPEQAGAAYDILVAHAGAFDSPRVMDSFVHAVCHAEPPCTEYRFQGRLGSGGKFRNNGNNGGVPHVDCYREHETPETLAIIAEVNERLAALFGGESRS